MVAHHQAAGAVPGHPAEVAARALADRLQRLEVRRPGGGMNADAFGGGVIDGDEHGGGPSLVQVMVGSVPHMVSAVSGMMVPSCARGPRADPTRVGANKALSRISRSTRLSEARVPAARSQAHTLR
jgi:hypothetical protein